MGEIDSSFRRGGGLSGEMWDGRERNLLTVGGVALKGTSPRGENDYQISKGGKELKEGKCFSSSSTKKKARSRSQ